MVFSSLAFLCAFLPVTFGLYCAMPGIRAKNALLLIASLAFYGYGEPVFVLLLVASALANWALGLCVLRADGSRRPGVLALAIAVDLAVLAVFKYAGSRMGLMQPWCCRPHRALNPAECRRVDALLDEFLS